MRAYNFVIGTHFLYTIFMFYIVGLGNPGEKYQNTRHNVGWLVSDYFCEKVGLPSLVTEKQNSARVTEGVLNGEEMRVIYPDTFMNNSGVAVSKYVSKSESQNMILIHDDIDLPFGQIKIGKGRGDGGNNGVKSIVDKLGTKDFIRVRIGIAPSSFWTGEMKRPKGGGPLERFVLKPFGKKEQKQLDEVLERAAGALEVILTEGVEKAMNKYN